MVDVKDFQGRRGSAGRRIYFPRAGGTG